MTNHSYERPLKPRIAKAVTNALKAAAFATLLCGATSYANSSAELSTLKSQYTNLEKSIQQDKQAIKQLERVIWGLDAKVLDAQKLIRKERDLQRAEYHDIKRDVKKQGFDIERLNNSIALIDQEIELVQRDSQRSQDYFQSLNAIKKQFEESSHLEKLNANQEKVETLLAEKQIQVETKDSALAKLTLLQQKLEVAEAAMEDSALEEDARFTNLVKKRERSGKQIIRMRKQLKDDQGRLSFLTKKMGQVKSKIAANKSKAEAKTVAKAKPKKPAVKKVAKSNGKQPAYVFAISGDQETNIEDALKLKDWVESYGAKYIQAKWNGFEPSESLDSTQFMNDFSNQLSLIDENAKIILIGHGRGGGAAIKAATEIAFNANRTIEFLAVIDPIGSENLRANIVYNTTVSCAKPLENDQLTNTEYVTCLRESKKRVITSNVKHFYNRWQKDGQGPADFYRRIKAIDEEGNDIESPTATGRFVTAQSILADQKRVFLADEEEAHKALLTEEARNLPRLLVKHLR